MKPVLPENEIYCIPFRIGVGASEVGPRLGGRHPQSTVPARNPLARYFATIVVRLEPLLEASVFLEGNSLIRIANAPTNAIADAGEVVHVVLHEPRPRAVELSTAPILSEHPLIMESAIEDVCGRTDVRSGHKLGGRPYLVQHRANLIADLAKMHGEGWRQIVQFEYRSASDAPWQGDWPFADGLFHLFAKSELDGGWRWLWQY